MTLRQLFCFHKYGKFGENTGNEICFLECKKCNKHKDVSFKEAEKMRIKKRLHGLADRPTKSLVTIITNFIK